MGKLDDLRAELLAAKQTIEPQIEGLKDFDSLNLHADSKAAIDVALEDYGRRLDLIIKGLAALDALSGDGYPNMPVRAVPQTIFSDLENNVDTIEAAFAQFAPIAQATKVLITAGTPVPRT
jgi:hypothetical protein